MSSFSARVFRGCSALLSPASKTSSAASIASKGKGTSSAGTEKPAAKVKAKANANAKPKSAETRTTARTGGIFKASTVSPALAQFLGTGEASRADAVKQIWSYIKTHNLQNPTDKRVILCDGKLKPLFEGKDSVGFLEIGKLLSHHFVKAS